MRRDDQGPGLGHPTVLSDRESPPPCFLGMLSLWQAVSPPASTLQALLDPWGQRARPRRTVKYEDIRKPIFLYA